MSQKWYGCMWVLDAQGKQLQLNIVKFRRKGPGTDGLACTTSLISCLPPFCANSLLKDVALRAIDCTNPALQQSLQAIPVLVALCFPMAAM